MLGGARSVGSHGGGEGRGHTVAAARLWLVLFYDLNYGPTLFAGNSEVSYWVFENVLEFTENSRIEFEKFAEISRALFQRYTNVN